MKNLKFLLFPTYVSVTLIKSKLQVHPVNPTNHEVLINKVLIKKIQFYPYLLEIFRNHRKIFAIFEFIKW